MATPDQTDEIVVSFRVEKSLVDEFMQSYRTAQSEGYVSPSGDRSEALRTLMKVAAENPNVFNRD